jgi:hypothetical protein
MPRTLVVSLLALTTAIGLGACGSDDDGGGGSTAGGGEVSTKPISLPETLGPFRDVVAASEAKGQKGPAANNARRHQERTKQRTEAAYSKAYDGAASAYRQYADEGLERLPWVIAVRSPSPGLTVGPASDPEYLLLATPEHEVKTMGEVECRIDWSPPALQGKTPDPESENVTMCQRSDDKLTVFAGGNGFKGPQGLQAMVDLTNQAWTAASG